MGIGTWVGQVDDNNNNNNNNIGNDNDNIDNFNNNGDVDEERKDGQDSEDDSASPSCSDKRSHKDLAAYSQWCEPVKIHATTSRKPKAGDYKLAAQKVLTEAISLYRGYFSMGTPYSSPMDKMSWAKKSWQDACKEC